MVRRYARPTQPELVIIAFGKTVGARGTVAAPMVKAPDDNLVQVHTAQQRKSAH